MIRLLGLVMLAFLIWGCLEAVVRALRGAGEERPSLPPPVPLVRCAGCGSYFPRAQALAGEPGGLYCSEECLRRRAGAAAS
jgi:hypothetical protein